MYRRSEKQLKKHRVAYKKGLLSCCMCSKQFEDKNHLDKHEDIHVVSGKHCKCLEKFQDGMECGSLYSHKRSLHAHVKENMEKPWQNQSTKEKMIKTSPGRAWRFTTQE